MGGGLSKNKHELSSIISENKRKQSAIPSNSSHNAIVPDYTRGLNADTAEVLVSYLPLNKIALLSCTSRSNQQLFQPITNAKAVLTAVVRGNPEEVARIVKANPAALFNKGQVTDLNGTTFYHVSPYQLMTFLCDDDMKNKIMTLIPDTLKIIKNEQAIEINLLSLRRSQYAEIDSGGADLVKLDQNPLSVPFEDLTRVIKRYDVMGEPTDLTLPLLANPDGIIFYNNQFYYANQKTKRVELIKPRVHSQQEQTALAALKASFIDMEMNSSRRSSNGEHELIANTMQHALVRRGIDYEHHGVRYRDSRADFNRLLNAYRKCIRLYQENQWDAGDASWCRGVGSAQREVVWILQRLCEENRPFPLPNFKLTPFKRGFNIYNYSAGRSESVVAGSGLLDGLGRDFAISGCGWWGPACATADAASRFDFVAVCRLVEVGKANVVEFAAESNLQSQNVDTDLHRRPG